MNTSEQSCDYLSDPVVGDRVRCLIRLVDQVPRKPCGQIRCLNAASVIYSPAGVVPSEAISTTHRVDAVLAPGEPGSVILATFLPYVAAVSAGRDCSLFSIGSSPGAQQLLFDRSASSCAALSVIEAIMSECKKRQQQCYISIGALDPRTEGSIDLLATKPGSIRPTLVQLSPSIRDGTIFPQLQQVNVSTFKRAPEVMKAALVSLTTLEEHATVSRSCDVFAVVYVEARIRVSGNDEYTTRISRLTLCDINHWQRSRQLHVSDLQAVDPFLGSDSSLRLLAFGVGLSSLCAIVASISTNAASEDLHVLRQVDKLRRVITYPTPPSSSQLHFLSAEDNCLWGATSELMVVRQLLNKMTGAEAMQSRCDALGNDLFLAMQGIRGMREILETKLPLAVDASLDDKHAHFIVETKMQILAEVEREQEESRKKLDVLAGVLAALPVIEGTVGVPIAIPQSSRVQLLESVLQLQQEENARLKQMFQRDVRLLNLELENARFAATKEFKTSKSPFFPVVDVFLEDAQIVLDSNTDESPDQFDLLVSNLSSSLRDQARSILDGELSKKIPTKEFTKIIFDSCVGKLRRSMGIAIEQPLAAKPLDTSCWTELVLSSFVTKIERDRLRNASAALALQTRRTICHLQELCTELEKSDRESAGLLFRVERCRLICETLETISQGQMQVLTNLATDTTSVDRITHFETTNTGISKSTPTHSSVITVQQLTQSVEQQVPVVHLSVDAAIKGIVPRSVANVGHNAQRLIHLDQGHFSRMSTDKRPRKVATHSATL